MHGDKKKLKSECGRRSESVQHITAVHATRVGKPFEVGSDMEIITA